MVCSKTIYLFVFFPLGDSPEYEFYVPTFPVHTTSGDGRECSETSEHKIQKPGNRPKERKQHLEYGESLKSRICLFSAFDHPTFLCWKVQMVNLFTHFHHPAFISSLLRPYILPGTLCPIFSPHPTPPPSSTVGSKLPEMQGLPLLHSTCYSSMDCEIGWTFASAIPSFAISCPLFFLFCSTLWEECWAVTS